MSAITTPAATKTKTLPPKPPKCPLIWDPERDEFIAQLTALAPEDRFWTVAQSASTRKGKVWWQYHHALPTAAEAVNRCSLGANAYIGKSDRVARGGAAHCISGYNAIVIDCDAHSGELYKTIDMVATAQYICQVATHKPHAVVHTGRGLQLWYFLARCPAYYRRDGRTRSMRKAYRVAAQTLCDDVKRLCPRGLDVDYAASCDPGRVARLPGSFSIAANDMTYIVPDTQNYAQQRYELRDLLPEMPVFPVKNKENKPKSEKNKNKPVNRYDVHAVRRDMITALVSLRGGNMTGLREQVLALYRYWVLLTTGINDDIALAATLLLNGQFAEPLDVKEVEHSTASALRAAQAHVGDPTKGWNYKSETLIELLGITAAEQDALNFYVAKPGNHGARTARRAAAREDKQQIREEQYRACKSQGLSIAATAEAMGLSTATIKRLAAALRKAEPVAVDTAAAA